MRSVCYAKATYYGMGFPPNFSGVTIFLFAALAPWPVFLQKAVAVLIFASVDGSLHMSVPGVYHHFHNPAVAMILPQRLHEKQHLLFISLCCDLSVLISTLYETAEGFWRLGWILRMRTYGTSDCWRNIVLGVFFTAAVMGMYPVCAMVRRNH